MNLGGDYSLSKRTDLYALAGYQKASGRTLDAKGSSIVVQASIGDFGVSSGADNQHKF